MPPPATSPIFETPPALPRGPHRLTREEVASSQRLRLLAAFAELMSEAGYSAVTIGALARRAGVSRAAFYAHFTDKEACLLAAYDQFARAMVAAMTATVGEDTPWNAFVETALGGYLGALERDPVAARAFIVEMDAAGPVARRRRNDAARGFAELIRQRHAAIRERDPSLGALPEPAYLGIAFGVRELVREAYEASPEPELTKLGPAIIAWVTAMIAGARR